MAEDQTSNIDSDMKTLFDTAAIIRKSITKCRKWKFTGSLKNLPDIENVPAELFSFNRWIIQGPKHDLSAGKKSEEVYSRAMALFQTTVSMCLTERQVKNKGTGTSNGDVKTCVAAARRSFYSVFGKWPFFSVSF